MALSLRLLRAPCLVLAACAAVMPACYSAGGGTAPPTSSFYFPTGLAVSAGGNVLYAINSDFDLQWNGGTLQSYDLYLIRRHAAELVRANLTAAASLPPAIAGHLLGPWTPGACPGNAPPPTNDGTGIGVPLGQACSPPVDSAFYERDSVIVGAFATDLQVSATGTRLFSPLSGATAVAWADLAADSASVSPEGATQDQTKQPFAPFAIACGTRVDGRCDAAHLTGNDPSSIGNTRNVTMPGEPFGMAQSQDGTALVVTSQTDTKTSLLTTGLSLAQAQGASAPAPVPSSTPGGAVAPPTMQFVLDGLPTGGVGIAAIPHEPGGLTAAGYVRCEDLPAHPAQPGPAGAPQCVRPAFFQTNRSSPEIDLIRYYADDGSTLHRPFLQKEATYQLSIQSGGSDFRGIAIDPTPRYACENAATTAADKIACAQKPARVFIASRTPPALVVGEVGEPSPSGDGTYDPDRLVITGLIPLQNGPSKVFLAPVVRPGPAPAAVAGAPPGPPAKNHLELRVFVVCFDSSLVYILDPNAPTGAQLEGVLSTGAGPYAMAFDPFDWKDVATGKEVPLDPRQPQDLGLKTYRFAYLASFTHSYLQVIDLDQAAPIAGTFEQIVYTVGKPTLPKGT